MAVVGWPALLIAWLVVTVFDPTAKRVGTSRLAAAGTAARDVVEGCRTDEH